MWKQRRRPLLLPSEGEDTKAGERGAAVGLVGGQAFVRGRGRAKQKTQPRKGSESLNGHLEGKAGKLRVEGSSRKAGQLEKQGTWHRKVELEEANRSGELREVPQ